MIKMMRKKYCVAAIVLAVAGAVIGAAGCRAGGGKALLAQGAAAATAEAEATLGSRIVRSADEAIAQPMRPYFASGLGLIVVGGLAAIAGARTMGLAAMALGGAIAAIGVVIVQYPWAILLAFLLAVAVAALALFSRWRKERELSKSKSVLSAAAQVIQNLPEGQAIKQGLAGLGGEIEAQVREVITPIKERLRMEGKIVA